MAEEKTYYNQSLWVHGDRQITNSNLVIEKFVSKDEWGISPPRLKVAISNFNTKTNSMVTLSHQDVFTFVMKFKEHEANISKICNEIKSNVNHQVNFSIKVKKSLIVTFLHKIEYGGACIRVVISDKTSDYLDSEKVYMSLYDFLSFMMILGQFRMNYLDSVNSINNIISIKELGEKLDGLNRKVESYYAEFHARSKLVEHTQLLQNNPILKNDFDLFSMVDDKPLDIMSNDEKIALIEKSNEVMQPSSSSSRVVDSAVQALSNDLNSFIKDNRDTFDIGIVDVPEKKTEPTVTKVISNTFTEKMLHNDITNLEVYFNNLNTVDLPFSKFAELIKSKLGFDALEGVTVEDINSMDYLLANYLKFYIKKNLELKQELPSNVSPVLLDNVNVNENKISLAYDLLLFSIYYNQLKNVLKEKDYSVVANKELMSFSLKLLTAPYIFGVLKNIDATVIASQVVSRFRTYTNNGVFAKLQETLKTGKSIQFNLSESVISSEASRMCKVLFTNFNTFSIKESFVKLSKIFIKLSYDDIQKNKLTSEQIKKIVAVEFNFRKNNRVNFSEAGVPGFDDIPISISEKYGIIIKKFDNTNLKRFIKEKCKDKESVLKYCLDLSNNINESYRDLKSVSIDFTLIPEEVLKSIVLWDLTKDNKIAINYVYFLDTIAKTTLTKDMMMSLLTDIQNINDPQFTNSFIAAREE